MLNLRKKTLHRIVAIALNEAVQKRRPQQSVVPFNGSALGGFARSAGTHPSGRPQLCNVLLYSAFVISFYFPSFHRTSFPIHHVHIHILRIHFFQLQSYETFFHIYEFRSSNFSPTRQFLSLHYLDQFFKKKRWTEIQKISSFQSSRDTLIKSTKWWLYFMHQFNSFNHKFF